MKKLLCIVFGISITISCVKYSSEDALEKILFAFENHLIKQRVLENNQGISYIKLLQEISEKNDVNYRYTYSFIDSIENRKKIDITRYLNDLGLDNAYDFEKLMHSNTEEMDLHPGMVAKKFLSITKASDFENTYFKLQFLLFFDLANISLN